MEPGTKKLVIFLIMPLVMANILAFIALEKLQPDYLLHAHFLDVGQGDSIFLQTHQGNQIVIDGGPDGRVLAELGDKMPFWDRTIELLILTHPDTDHIGGFADILDRYRVEKIIMTKVQSETAVFSRVVELLEKKGTQIIYGHAGMRVWLDSATVFDIYHPSEGIEQNSGFSINNTSIFGKLTFGNTKILFTGDVDSIIEDTVISLFDVDSDILKVGHHGSKHSTSVEFAAAVSPQYAVIQVGKNSYGHPTDEVLDILAKAQAEVLRTDQVEDIRFISDGFRVYPAYQLR